MIYDYFAGVDADGIVRKQLRRAVPNDGPSLPDDGFVYYPMVAPIEWGAQPTPTSVLLWNDGAPLWMETATLDELKAARSQQINIWKLEANNTYFDFADKKIAYKDADRIEIQAINNVVLLTGVMPTDPDWPAAWKTMDNTWIPIPDKEAWTAFNVAIAARGTAHFKRAQALKAELARADSPAAIEAITW